MSEPSSWDELLGGKLVQGDVLAEKYRLEAIIGQGAMGFVLKARHLQLDEPVAVKFLMPELAENEEALERFEREAQAAFRIKSEHVARVLDVGRVADGAPFMVMEFLEGTDLADILERDGALSIPRAVDHILEACDAIAEAHQLGIVHRDLKPENLFVVTRRDGSSLLKVLDFGLSKLVATRSGHRPRALTSAEQVMGTAHYMSPEQWMATKDVGPATDIWALGVILYELITNHSPFLREKMAQMCNAVLRDMPPPLAEKLPDAPPGLQDAIFKCLAKKSDERHANVGELAAALEPHASDAGAALAQRIAMRIEQGPPSSRMRQVLPGSVARALASAQGSPSERALAAGSKAASGALPRLGLVSPEGSVDSWHDILMEATPSRSRWPLVLGALLLLALLIVGIALATAS